MIRHAKKSEWENFRDFLLYEDFKRIRLYNITLRQWLKVLWNVVLSLLFMFCGWLPYAFISALCFPIGTRTFFLWGFVDGLSAPANMIMHVFNTGRLIISPYASTAYLWCYWFVVVSWLLAGLFVAFVNAVYLLARFSQPKMAKQIVPSTFDSSKNKLNVFISSTFEDMAEERDILMIQVFPKLKQEALRRGVTLVPIDLRWGITQREAESGQVIGRCLDYLNDSSTVFIGLVGDRYGWQPTSNDLDIDPTLKSRYPWLSDCVESGMSMTQIEFMHCALHNGNSKEGIVFIEGANSFLSGLFSIGASAGFRRWVIDSGFFSYASYLISEDLATKVEVYVRNLLDKYFPLDAISEADKIESLVKEQIARYTDFYMPTENERQILDFLVDDKVALVVYGAEGIGKRASVINLLEQSGLRVLYLLDNDAIKKAVNVDVQNRDVVVWRFDYKDEVLSKFLSEFYVRFEKFDNNIPKHIVIIETSDIVPESTSKVSAIKMQPLSMHEREKMLTEYFARFFKKISVHAMRKLLSSPLLSTPGMLLTVADEMIVFGRHELLESKIDEIVQLNSVRDLCNYLFECWERKFDKDDFSHVMKMFIPDEGESIEYFSNDMIKEEMRIIHNCKALDIGTDGKVRFKNSYFRQAAKSRYCKHKDIKE